MDLYRNHIVTLVLFVCIALASAHLVEYFMATSTYQLLVCLAISVMGPIRTIPHFKKHANDNIGYSRPFHVMTKLAYF